MCVCVSTMCHIRICRARYEQTNDNNVDDADIHVLVLLLVGGGGRGKVVNIVGEWVMISGHHARVAESYFYDFLLTHI